jgi:hypothetical protein
MITRTNTNDKNLQKYNMFVAQIGCAACGVIALSLFGPGWLARSAALSSCIAFMTITGSTHPPGKIPKTNYALRCRTAGISYVLYLLIIVLCTVIISGFSQLQACPFCLLMAPSFMICNFGTRFSLVRPVVPFFA